MKVRWHVVKRRGRAKNDSRELEDKCIWLLQCSALDHLRQSLLEAREDNPRKSNGERESSPDVSFFSILQSVQCSVGAHGFLVASYHINID